MIVMKFGGTSVEDPECIERVASIIRDRLAQRPVIVVSAMGKTTQMLLDAARASAAGDGKSSTELVSEIRARHLGHARELIKRESQEEIRLIDQYFDELRKLLEGLAVLGDVPPRGLDKILSYGELLSSAIVSGSLIERGVPSRLLDARQFIKTDDRFGMASPIAELTNRLVGQTVVPVVESGSVPVIQGFIGSALHGATTTLGFEGSDYTAAIVGSALDASDIQIWKDVSGLMTADPAIMSGARTVKACTYQEAAELTYFGAKVLHPKAIYPAAAKNIPVHIYNSRRPAATGTAITAAAPACSNVIKSIAYKRPISVIRFSATAGPRTPAAEAHFGHQDGSLNAVLNAAIETLARRGAAPLLAMVTGSCAIIALPGAALEGDNGRYLIDQIQQLGPLDIHHDQAIVSVVGESLKTHRDRAAPMLNSMLRALPGLEIGLVVHGSSPIVTNLLIGQNDVEDAVSRLHELFFNQLDPAVFE